MTSTKIVAVIGKGTSVQIFDLSNQQDLEHLYVKIHHRACDMCMAYPELEIRSAIKQAASDHGIAYGDEMGRCVEAVEKMLLETC